MRLRPRLKLTDKDGAGATFGDLPFEMMAEIFDKLDSMERQKLRSVARSWNKAISNLYLLELHIQNSNWLTIINTEGRTISVVMSGILEKFDLNQRLQQFDTFCSRLRKLEFSGITIDDNFLQILRKCHNLQKMTINKVSPVKTVPRVRTRSNAETLEGSSVFPEGWELFRDWFPMLTSLCFNFNDRDHKLFEGQLNLFQVVADMLVKCKLSKLKIISESWEFDFNTTPLGLIHGSPDDLPLDNLKHQQILKSLITSNKSTLRKLEIVANRTKLKLQFYAEAQGNISNKLRVEQFSGYQSYFENSFDPEPTASPWLTFLLRQDGLKTLDMNSLDYFYENLFGTQQMSQIFLKNYASLTVVNFVFAFEMSIITRVVLSDALALCTNLKSLTIKGRSWTRRCPIFTDTSIGQLPSSLKFFCTDFSIATEATEIEGLQLTNLKNLETFVWSATPWFIFKSTRSTKLTVDNFKTLRSKFPGLKTMLLKVGDYEMQLDEQKQYIHSRVSSELITLFRDNLLLKEAEPYLKMELDKMM